MDGFITGFFFRVSLYFLVCLLRMEEVRKKGLGMKRRKLGNQIVLVFEFSLAFCGKSASLVGTEMEGGRILMG